MPAHVDDAHLERIAAHHFQDGAPGHCAYLRQLKAGGFEPQVIYDIGACVLHWTTYARSLWPDARIIVFDAFDRAEFLYRRSGLEYHMGVLSDTDGRVVEFYQSDAQPGGNSYYREIGCGQLSAELFPIGSARTMVASTVDAVAAARGFPAPDLVKIDVQGCELDILLGAVRTFAATRHMIVEMQHTDYNEGAPREECTTPIITGRLGWTLVGQIQVAQADADYAFTRPGRTATATATATGFDKIS